MPRLIIHGFTISLDGYGAATPARALRSLLTSLLFVSGFTLSATNPAWVKLDKNMITAVVQLDLTDPSIVERYFTKQAKNSYSREAEDLGFNWKMSSCSIGGGYVSIRAEFYYFADSIVAYRLIPGMPDEPELQAKYLEWYAPAFLSAGGKIQDRRWSTDALRKPLGGYPGRVALSTLSDSLRDYMSPFSTTTYGVRGGEASQLLWNRRFFLGIEKEVSDEVLLLLMYSVNPASRLTAIEYYYRRGNKPGDDQHVDAWIERVFKDPSEVHTLSGCIGHMDNSKELVAKMINER